MKWYVEIGIVCGLAWWGWFFWAARRFLLDDFCGLFRFLWLCLRCYRDWMWTIAFFHCAVTVANRVDGAPVYNLAGGVLRARVRYRFDGRLVTRLEDLPRDYVEVSFAGRGVAWVPGHDGSEVDALEATAALS